ncbi:MAG: undecaprenyl-diphosphatase, partial [Enterocloster sp.]|nr:undecaprenyl-diphosphatase [Enterocloster sp.]
KIVTVFLDGDSFTGSQLFDTLLGMAVAFGVSVYSIQFLMSYVRRHNFKFFGYYRIILGAIVLAYFGITALAV